MGQLMKGRKGTVVLSPTPYPDLIRKKGGVKNVVDNIVIIMIFIFCVPKRESVEGLASFCPWKI